MFAAIEDPDRLAMHLGMTLRRIHEKRVWVEGQPERHALTPRETEILQLAARGLTNPAIAAVLHCVSPTVAQHMTAIFVKLRAQNRTHAVAIMDDRSPGWRERLA